MSDEPARHGVSLAAHPRARASIRRTRARVALGAFAIVLLVALPAGVPAADAVGRALLAGTAAHMCAWAAAIAIWRHIVVAELAVAQERRRRAAAARADAAARS